MNDVKTLVRIVITLICLHGIIVSGQTLTRRQLRLQQRQQTQVDQQQELLEKQLLSQLSASPSMSQNPSPINHAVIDSIFNVPIQAIKAVNELVRTLAAVRARLNLTQTSADLVEDVE